MVRIWTVGHSNHDFESFLALLTRHAITAIADVRSSPYSRFHSTFNREALKARLNENDIVYAFLGAELGARSMDPSCYLEGQVQYRRLAQTDLFRVGLERVTVATRKYRVALMCAEAEPLECHRAILVARELEAMGCEVVHILRDGESETHRESMRRLAERHGLLQGHLFSTGEDPSDEAYRLQEAIIAYRQSATDVTGVAEGE